ncbi:MAG: hypothetical protein LBG62_01545 [Candidatus Methanoplasma sp.]|nr:hypothetical protein [Candidatus Methanoplasma sp.]
MESASRGTYHDESRYCDAELDEDAIAKLCSDLSIYGKRAFSRMDLVNKRVIRRDAGGEYPTLAYALLTGAPVPMSTIECARFRGVEKGEFTSMKSFGGPIYEQLEKAHEFVLDRLDNAVTVSERSISRTETYEIPDAAVREAIVNAVTHRNYAVNNARIYVSVFDDRVEVRSPGTVPVGMTLKSAMSGESAVRNRAIAEMFRSAGISEGWGNGIIRIRSLCMEQGLREPLFEERSSSFVVTLFRPARQGRGGAAGAREIHEGCRSAIVRYIAENGGATRREIGSLPGCAFSDLPEEKRYVKVSNIIRSLVRRGEIYNAGSDRRPRYVLPERGDGSPADAPRIR